MKEKPSYYAVLTADVRYDERLNANAKLLYAEITALSEKTGQCWASDNYFSELYGVTTRTVQNWLKELENRGYIKRDVIYKENSKEIEKRYITIANKALKNTSVPYRKNLQYPTENNFVDNTTRVNTTRVNKTYGQIENFNEFWKEYPNKKNKKKAKDKYLKDVDKELHQIIMNDLRVRKKSKDWTKEDGIYIPHPTTYLNGERWNDEIETNTNTSIYDTPIL